MPSLLLLRESQHAGQRQDRHCDDRRWQYRSPDSLRHGYAPQRYPDCPIRPDGPDSNDVCPVRRELLQRWQHPVMTAFRDHATDLLEDIARQRGVGARRRPGSLDLGGHVNRVSCRSSTMTSVVARSRVRATTSGIGWRETGQLCCADQRCRRTCPCPSGFIRSGHTPGAQGLT